MRPLIIGEAPSKNEKPPTPIAGRVGKRLAKCAGLTLEEFLAHFDRMNILEVRQDTADHGFTFDHVSASIIAGWFAKRFIPGQTVLLLGWRVAKAFDVCQVAYFERYEIGGANVYVLPHPSGVNRWWNDLEHMQQADNFMLDIVRRTRF